MLNIATANYLLSVKQANASSTMPSQLLLLVAGGILGVIGSYITARLNARHDPRKQLSWDADMERGLVTVGSRIRNNVSVSYKGEPVGDLLAVKCRITNTGNQVVKDEIVRFAFADQTKILEADFASPPEPELKCSLIDLDATKPLERSFRLGHLEAGQEVAFEFIIAGPRADDWKIHSFNEAGNVLFRQRDVNRIKAEQEHVTPFSIIVIAIAAISLIAPSVEATGVFIFNDLWGVVLLIQLGLLMALTPHLLPVARLLRRLIDQWLIPPIPTTNVVVEGGNPSFVASSGTLNGDVRMENTPHT
jgi:hypothetical protein